MPVSKKKRITPENPLSTYEPHIAQGLTQMFVAGTSTHKVGEVAQTLLGVARSRQHHQSPSAPSWGSPARVP